MYLAEAKELIGYDQTPTNYHLCPVDDCSELLESVDLKTTMTLDEKCVIS